VQDSYHVWNHFDATQLLLVYPLLQWMAIA